MKTKKQPRARVKHYCIDDILILTFCSPQQGVMVRNDLGFIMWSTNEEKTMNFNLVTKNGVGISLILILSRVLA